MNLNRITAGPPFLCFARVRRRQRTQVLEINPQQAFRWRRQTSLHRNPSMEPQMNLDLRHFLVRLLGAVAMALVPVVLTAFMTMPLSLGRHPGDAVPQGSAVLRHMT